MCVCIILCVQVLPKEEGRKAAVHALTCHAPLCVDDAKKSRALQMAATNGHVDVCRLLLGWPSHPARASARESLALITAAENGHQDVCRILLSQTHYPALLDAQNSLALKGATKNKHKNVCRFLISCPPSCDVGFKK